MKIQAKCIIPASREVCFNAFSDLNTLSQKVTAIKNIEILTPGEIGIGTKFKETRLMLGNESSEVMEITVFDRNSHIREEAHSGGIQYISDWKFTESDKSTVVSIDFSIQGKTFFAKLMCPLFILMSGIFKKAFMTDMEEVKQSILASAP